MKSCVEAYVLFNEKKNLKNMTTGTLTSSITGFTVTVTLGMAIT